MNSYYDAFKGQRKSPFPWKWLWGSKASSEVVFSCERHVTRFSLDFVGLKVDCFYCSISLNFAHTCLVFGTQATSSSIFNMVNCELHFLFFYEEIPT